MTRRPAIETRVARLALTARRSVGMTLAITIVAMGMSFPAMSYGQGSDGASLAPAAAPEPEAEEVHTIPIPSDWKRLGTSELWLDLESKSVIVGGTISLRRGGLEMFACPVGTKEHESIVALNALASEVHAALLAVGAKSGKPVQWEPKYQSATGAIIDIQVTWREPGSSQTVTRWAKELVRGYQTGRGLDQDWVFGGSVTETDPDSGETFYWGDGGELICLSNFSSATIDLNVPSSNSNEALMYEAFTENLPARGTKAYVRLTPGKFFGGEK